MIDRFKNKRDRDTYCFAWCAMNRLEGTEYEDGAKWAFESLRSGRVPPEAAPAAREFADLLAGYAREVRKRVKA